MNYKMYLLLTSILFSFSFNSWSQDNNPVVMKIDDQSIHKDDFLRTYLKNNENPKYDKESLDKYMDLYEKFKLKVAEAEVLGYDTIPSLEKELKGYEDQLAQPYLIDSAKTKELIQEAYNHMQHEIQASHILIKLPKNPSPEDTLKAYKKAMAIRKRIENGEDFIQVAKEVSDDPSAQTNSGELGYFTAFQMVYPFEMAAYKTKIGAVSEPVRTRFGYHLLTVTDKRKARGTMTTAHIMVAMKQNPTEAEVTKAKKKIDEIYQKLQDGESFEKLARLYSDDQGSKMKGGRLNPFGSGTSQRMVPSFENAAFALKEDGDYSKPIRTDYGFHIVKRLKYKPLGTLKEVKPFIEQKLKQSGRLNQSKKVFVNDLKAKNEFVDKGEKSLPWFYANIDSSIFKKNWDAPKLNKNQWMFKYRNEKYDMQMFMEYISHQKLSRKMPVKKYINQLYEQWQTAVIMADEKSRLKDEYPEYKALSEEYHDGILLYQIMKDKVWDKAITDSAGLEAYFEKHIDKYQWPKRVKATIYSSPDKEMVLKAKKLAANDTMDMTNILDSINKDSQLNITGERSKYVQSKSEILSQKGLKFGKNDIFKNGDRYYFVILEKSIPPGPKDLNETRGIVIQDYQNYLEEQWLKELRKKHTITINKKVLYSLGD